MTPKELGRLGYFLYINRNLLLGLDIALVLGALILALPSFAIWKVGVTFVLPMAVVFQFFLAGVLSTQLLGRSFAQGLPPGHLAIVKGSDHLAAYSAVIAAISTAIAAVLMIVMLGGCSTRSTPESLASWVYGESANCSAPIDWLNLTRRPYFATDFTWYQGCQDDKPVVIAFLILSGYLIVVDVALAVLQFRVRMETVKLAQPLELTASNKPPGFTAFVGQQREAIKDYMLPVFTIKH